MKQKHNISKKHHFNGNSMSKLAEDLIALLDVASEYCTPGHRMGHCYHLFIYGLANVTQTKDTRLVELQRA